MTIQSLMIEFTIEPQPVGFIVYAHKEGQKLSLGAYCTDTGAQILDVMKVMTVKGGFKPEPADALAFFLFEENAKAFIQEMS